MATFIDERDEAPELEEGEELQNFEENSQEEQPQEDNVDEASEEEALPEKYQGKSVKDIIAMHQNAEQLLGKQGQEVGELRKIVDDFIRAQNVSNTAHSAQEDLDETDFFTNPKDAISKLLENHPSIQQSKELAVQLKQQETLAKVKAAHPDFMEVVQDPKFAEWVGKSKVRTRLLQDADKQYDFDAADELLTLWKERQQTVTSTVNADKANRKQQVKSASAGTSAGSGERPSRKIYRRADIIELMRKDPQRYEDLMPEIRQAYAEGRVK
jgi:hypothetical protein